MCQIETNYLFSQWFEGTIDRSVVCTESWKEILLLVILLLIAMFILAPFVFYAALLESNLSESNTIYSIPTGKKYIMSDDVVEKLLEVCNVKQ